MTRARSFRELAPALAAAVILACAAEPPTASVTILQPRDDTVISADSVSVSLLASGIEIVAADGQDTPGRAHHHLFLDVDLTPPGQPIPTEVPGIVHLGTGASHATPTGLTPGRHRLIAVLARGNHVPLDPWAVDTVHFQVSPGTSE